MADTRLQRRERDAIEAVRSGDWEGVHILYVRYADQVCRRVETIVGDPHSAQDVTQEVFARLIRAIGSYQPRAVPFRAWILRVASNAALDHLRARRQIPVAEVRPLHEADEGKAADQLDALVTALGDLPESQREVMVLRHIGGYTPGEIARHMGRTESSVQAIHHRGRGSVKKRLTDLGAAPATVSV